MSILPTFTPSHFTHSPVVLSLIFPCLIKGYSYQAGLHRFYNHLISLQLNILAVMRHCYLACVSGRMICACFAKGQATTITGHTGNMLFLLRKPIKWAGDRMGPLRFQIILLPPPAHRHTNIPHLCARNGATTIFNKIKHLVNPSHGQNTAFLLG